MKKQGFILYLRLCYKNVEVKVTPLHAYADTRGGSGILTTHFKPCTRERWVVVTMLWPLYLWQKPGTHCTGGGVGIGASLDSTENFAYTKIQSLDHPDCSELLCQLHYPGHPRLYIMVR
jgi:hypothetical protein